MLAKLITSTQHPIVKQIVLLRKDPRRRRKENKALLFGEKMIQEWPVNKELCLLITEKTSSFFSPCVEHIKVSTAVLKKMAGYEEKALAVVPCPKPQDVSKAFFVLALDRIQDPANMGGLFRSALGLFVEGIILLEGSCDPFHEKSIRASKGSVFSLPFQKFSPEEFLFWIQNTKKDLFVADLEGTSLEKIRVKNSSVLLLGNEGKGPASLFTKEGKKITIPMSKKLESYNVTVAASLILYQLKASSLKRDPFLKGVKRKP